MSNPEDLATLMATLPEVLTSILGTNLVGVYIYGSALDQTYDPARSDIDCIAVTEQALTEVEFNTLAEWFAEAAAAAQWVERLQMSFLIRDSVLEENSGACLYQSGALSRSGSDGNPIIWLDLLQRGRTLFGAAPESFLPEITGEIFRAALVREVGYLRKGMSISPDGESRDKRFYRVYAVLTLCRILYSARTGRIASKAWAGRWALKHVPGDWHGLIHQALDDDGSGGLDGLPVRQIRAFIEYTHAEVDSLPLISPPR